MHVVKIQELLNTADRNLAKVTPRPKCESCNVYLQKGVYLEGQKKSKIMQSRFYMHLKNRDHRINNTLFLCIAAGTSFFFY